MSGRIFHYNLGPIVYPNVIILPNYKFITIEPCSIHIYVDNILLQYFHERHEDLTVKQEMSDDGRTYTLTLCNIVRSYNKIPIVTVLIEGDHYRRHGFKNFEIKNL